MYIFRYISSVYYLHQLFILQYYDNIILIFIINALLLTFKSAMCKKTYPELINETHRKIVFLTYSKY